jgi:hypothetical protein
VKGPQFHLPPNLRAFAPAGQLEAMVRDRMEYASHQQTLVGAVMRSRGPVLELGAGDWSTPILHEICRAQGRYLLTLENEPEWIARFRHMDTRGAHRIELVHDWASCDAIDHGEWSSVVFIDHAPTERRALELARVRAAGGARFVVVHDTEPRYRHQYPGLEDALAAFTYRRDFCELEPWTSVVSDVGPIWSE